MKIHYPVPLYRQPGLAHLGYPSGHSAVAVTLAAIAARDHGRISGASLWAAAITVALSRMYVGAHLPLDVVGGAAIGVAIGAATNRLIDGLGSAGTIGRLPG